MTDLTRLRSLAESLNSPQSKRRETMAGVLYEARREVAGILADLEWRDISTAPLHHFVILVRGPYGTLTAFRDVNWDWWQFPASDALDYIPTHWQPLPEPPVLAVKTDGDRNE